MSTQNARNKDRGSASQPAAARPAKGKKELHKYCVFIVRGGDRPEMYKSQAVGHKSAATRSVNTPMGSSVKVVVKKSCVHPQPIIKVYKCNKTKLSDAERRPPAPAEGAKPVPFLPRHVIVCKAVQKKDKAQFDSYVEEARSKFPEFDILLSKLAKKRAALWADFKITDADRNGKITLKEFILQKESGGSP